MKPSLYDEITLVITDEDVAAAEAARELHDTFLATVCPIAQALRRGLGLDFVTVGHDETTIYTDRIDADHVRAIYTNDMNAKYAIDTYDEGRIDEVAGTKITLNRSL